MPRYRPPLDPFTTPADYRAFYPHPHPDAMKVMIRQTLEALQPSLQRRFAEINDYYQAAKDAKRECDEFLEKVKANNMSWDGLDGEQYFKASQRLRFAESECELAAEHLLLLIDGIVSVLVNELTGRDNCLDAGDDVASGFTIDRILDAVGNYVRHRYEWKQQLAAGGKFTPRQMSSIRPLAALIAGAPPSSDEEAAATVLTARSPALAVLDVVTNYQRDGEGASYDTLHEHVTALCGRLIDAKFSEWYRRKYQAPPSSP